VKERQYQTKLIKKIKEMFPDCYVVRNDPAFSQGIPDILILFNDKWAMLEIKLDDNSPRQPNQEYYIEYFAEMSFASFINPNNEEEVLNALQQAFGLERETCVS
jgi:hypothetical protein